MSSLRTATERTAGAHVCRLCTMPLVQPQDAERSGRDWLVQLYCPSCDWSGETLLDQAQMDDLDEALDDGFAMLAAALAQITQANMHEYAERFTAALAADAVLPEDF
jgi:putative zinc ribbon protein